MSKNWHDIKGLLGRDAQPFKIMCAELDVSDRIMVNIIDLTDDYIKHVIKACNRQAYEKCHLNLFRHYYQFWAKRNQTQKVFQEDDILKKLQLIKKNLTVIYNTIQTAGFDCEELDMILFVGEGTSNGHAFKDGNKFVVWLPVETYHTSLLVKVFVTHEIIHTLHYTKSPGFYFDDKKEKERLSRQLITEGLATYLTLKIWNIDEKTALWADYLSDNDAISWMKECFVRKAELYRFVLENFSCSDNNLDLFRIVDSDNIFKFRAGYYVGLQIIKQLVDSNKIKLKDLLGIPRDNFEQIVFEQLKVYVSCQ